MESFKDPSILSALAIAYLVIFLLKSYRSKRNAKKQLGLEASPRIGLDPYEVLEIPPQADIATIKEAYKRKCESLLKESQLPTRTKILKTVAQRKKLEADQAYQTLLKNTKLFDNFNL